MSLPLEQISSAIREQLPKALVGLVIPAGQLIWKTWRDRKVNTRAAALRTEITQLAQFLQTPFGDSPNAIAIRRNTQEQYERALDSLAVLSQPRQPKPIDISQNTSSRILQKSGRVLQKILLLYTPRSFKGWVAHFLYYIVLAFTVLGILGITMSGAASEDLGAAIGGLAFYAVLTFLIWRWAIRTSDLTHTLNQTPNPRWGWLPVALIVITVIFGLSVIAALCLDDQEEPSLAAVRNHTGALLLVIAVSSVVIIACVRWRRRIDKNRPRPRWAWVPVTLIVISAYTEFGVLMGTGTNDQDEFSLKAFRDNLALLLGMTAACGLVIVLSALWRRRMYKRMKSDMKPQFPAELSEPKVQVIEKSAGTGAA